MIVLDVRNLRVRFDTRDGPLFAVDDVSFTLEEGQTLGLVGESGSGKTVTGLALMGLVPSPPGQIETGEVLFNGRNLLTLPQSVLRGLRGRGIAMVFQDALGALNPLLTVGRQMSEMLEVHLGSSRREARKRCAHALGEVGMADPEARLDSYPHELSGGMCQRVMIAMALSCNPRVLIADEPTTALDVTIQAQVLDLLRELQHEHGTSVLLISHDLGVLSDHAERIMVMYAGRMVELAPTAELFLRPLHPYTAGLLQCMPTLLHPPEIPLLSIPGSPPDLTALGRGCAFEPRCSFAALRCGRERPEFLALTRESNVRQLGGRRAACFEIDRVAATELYARGGESPA